MDTTLVGVTLLSLGMAAALSVIVWRLLRDERQRSDARVAALAGMAARTPAPPQEAAPHGGLDLPMREDGSTPIAVGSMFEERREPSPWGHRAAVMAALGMVAATFVLFALAANGTRAQARGAALVSKEAARRTPTPAPSLELISLRDARQSGALTITGLVRNPLGAASLERVTVTAYTFDDSGSFLASGRALIDVTLLAAGDESPFVVSVPVTEPVSRYRIGFRSEDGHVIAHVDKRQPGPMASLQPVVGQNW